MSHLGFEIWTFTEVLGISIEGEVQLVEYPVLLIQSSDPQSSTTPFA